MGRDVNLNYIYMITCKINNKKYIGATRRNVADRWHDYVGAYHRGYFSITQPNNEEGSLLFDMLKYGLNNFTFEVIEVVSRNELFKKETEYIKKFNTKYDGYNNIESESENGDVENILETGKETRFKKGGLPHNSVPIKAFNDDSCLEFNSYNEATRYFMELIPEINSEFTFNQIQYKIREATKKNLIYLEHNWYKDGTTDLNYMEKEFFAIKFLKGETYKNNKNLEFEIIEVLKNSKRKIRFLKTGYETISDTKEISNGSIKDWESPTVCDIGIVGKEIEKPQSHPLYDKWRDMIRRCYGKVETKNEFTLDDRWIRFSNYIEDVSSLENGKDLIKNKKFYRIHLKSGVNHFSKDNILISKINSKTGGQ